MAPIENETSVSLTRGVAYEYQPASSAHDRRHDRAPFLERRRRRTTSGVSRTLRRSSAGLRRRRRRRTCGSTACIWSRAHSGPQASTRTCRRCGSSSASRSTGPIFSRRCSASSAAEAAHGANPGGSCPPPRCGSSAKYKAALSVAYGAGLQGLRGAVAEGLRYRQRADAAACRAGQGTQGPRTPCSPPCCSIFCASGTASAGRSPGCFRGRTRSTR